MEILLQTHNLTKKYGGFTALNEVSLNLNQGDIYGLVGRNGAGKTTFFKCVMGLAKASGGEIEINGSKSGLDKSRRKIGFMISPAFFPYLNPRQNLKYLCRIKGVKAKGEIDRLLELVGLKGVKKPFKAFSLGMKQRLGIASALLGNPPVIILDEPINGLDPQGIADIRALIKKENNENGTTFIVSSHILSELDLVATRFGFIEQGNLVEQITHTDLHEHTKKSLIVDVDDGQIAAAVLKAKLGVEELTLRDNRLILDTHLDQPDAIAKALVQEGVALYRLAPQETTLEEYFMKLIGGGKHA
ncbi:MAG: ABC transporter ATP-binding protein [Erysipelotrichaceae bacterium]|jgi:ABC-2 type transport system ATP-binding protein|nr:ABC transporter ATP-binding protein [Erysipelotrichaceae bacterium]